MSKLSDFFTDPIMDYIAASVMFTLAQSVIIYTIFNFDSINNGDYFTVVLRYGMIICLVTLISWMGIHAIRIGRSKK